MKLKLVLLSAAFAMYLQPAHSSGISNLASSALNTAQEIASFVPNVVKAKGSAVSKAAADMASIVAIGAGLKVNAIGNAVASMKHAVADGMNAVGEVIMKAGNTLTGDSPSYKDANPSIRVRPPYAVRCAVDPCSQEVVEFKVSPHVYQRHEPSVWKMLRHAAERRMHGRGRFYNYRYGAARRPHFVYEVINTPRWYRGPMGTFHIQKK